MLNCGTHSCQSKCHQLADHSKMLCQYVMTSNCPNSHAQTWKCHEKQPLVCRVCDREAKRAAEKQRKDFELQQKRDAEQQAHDEKMAKIRERLDVQIQAQKDLQLKREREAALKQQEQDVKDAEERVRKKIEAEKKRKEEEEEEEARKAAEKAAASASSIAALFGTVRSAVNSFAGTSKQPSSDNTKKKESKAQQKKKESEAQKEWQRRKYTDGVVNPHIDAIMDMIGLEPVKQQVLKIMDKVDVNIRQGTSLDKERFNAVLLGNPGTGIVCMVARREMLADDTLQERLPLRDTMLNSWLLWMFFLVTSSRKPPEPNSETRESLAPRRWSRKFSRLAEVVSSSTRRINSPPITTTGVPRYWTTC